jgi:hypothetical protein
MDNLTLVTEKTQDGTRLIEALATEGFDVRVAFWAKPTEAGKWYLYLASPFVDDPGPFASYDLVHSVLLKRSDLWFDPFEVKVIGLRDSLTKAALAAIKPDVPGSPYAVPNPRPYPRLTWIGAGTFGGRSIDGAYIYPPFPSSEPAQA